MKKRLIVIGGGAAGFFCAVNAASKDPELEVIIVEKTGKLLSKVRVSGGGRCNVTHACSSITEMARQYPRGEKFVKQAFHHFFTNDTIGWFQTRNVPLKTEPDGRMFPVSNTSETIVHCLMQEASKFNVQILMNREIVELNVISILTPVDEKDSSKKRFQLTCKDQTVIAADFVCIACGGYNKPDQYKWLSGLRHTYDAPVPSLFTFNIPANPIVELMGISVEEAIVKIDATKFSQSGPLLITHWGFSGPAILKLSSFAARILASKHYNFSISINWLAGYNENSLLARLKVVREELASQKIINRNPFGLPQRLWQYHIRLCQVKEDARWADLPAKQQNLLAKQLCSQQFFVKGKTTFKEEFVTAGGINLSEINSATMMSNIVPHLFFAGEILDVDGITGGFNFQHAWTSGWLAANEIGKVSTGIGVDCLKQDNEK